MKFQIASIVLVFCLLIFFVIQIFNNNSNLNNFSDCPLVKKIELKEKNHKGLFNKVLIIGGVHGNEPAPAYGIEEFLKKYKSKIHGNVTFLPRVNSEGILQNTRFLPCKSTLLINYDINRHFKYNEEVNEFQKNLIQIVDDHDFILDFHEAYDFHIKNSNSVGSAFLPANNYQDIKKINFLQDLSIYLKKKIDMSILDKNKKFSVITNDKYDIKNTLRDYCEKSNKLYILVEITGQEDKQPMELRKDQTKVILESFLRKLNMYIG